jgi:hypothetical protein
LTILAKQWDSQAVMLPLPAWSRALSTAARALLVTASLTLVALGALGCAEEAPVKKPPKTSEVDSAEHEKLEKERKTIAEANRAINEKKYARARKLLREAAALGAPSQRFEIEMATAKLDKREAKLIASDVSDKLKTKDCKSAIEALAGRINEVESEAFTTEIRRLVFADARKCLEEELDDKVLAVAYADARKLANAPAAKAVLGPSMQKRLAAQLEDTILNALGGQIEGDLRARKWAQAVEKIDDAVKKGDATVEQGSALLASVRGGIAQEIIATATRALGQQDAPQALEQIDAQIKLVRWEVLPPDTAAVATDKALPADVARKRELLATWVEAQRAGLKLLKKSDKRWAHGKIALVPPHVRDGAAKRELSHGTEVWILGTTKDGRALLAGSDPFAGPLPATFDKVIGWAPLDHLAREPTIDWVVPDDQLNGELVWAPLRKDEPLWELGTVTEVSGKDVSVKRVADDVVVKVTRKQLRSGRLTPGTRVITFCTAKDQPAKIEEVRLRQSVKLKCDGGKEKEEALASLRTKPDLLPPSK